MDADECARAAIYAAIYAAMTSGHPRRWAVMRALERLLPTYDPQGLLSRPAEGVSPPR